MWRALYSIFVVLLFIGLTVWLGDRYFFVLPANNLTASQIAEMGDFATAPRYRDLARTYLNDLKGYQALSFTPISSAEDVDGIARAIDPMIRGTRLASTEPAGADVIAGLSKHVALLIARCAGMPREEYLKELGPGVVFNVPQHSLGHLAWAMQIYLPGETAPDQNADPAIVQAVFEKFYALGDSYRGGSSRVVAFSTDAAGFKAALTEMPAGTAFDMVDPLDSQFSASDEDFFWGRLSFGDLVLTTPLPSSQDATTVLRSSICIIMKTAGGDIYPFHFNSYFDPDRKQWLLLFAERACSPRMGKTPPIAY
jgi:hypothetical protein